MARILLELNVKLERRLAITCKEDRMEWRFSTPLAPWMARAIESMVKLAKRAIKVTRNDLTEETLVTLLAEIESVINSCPLAPLNKDPNDLEALTVNHITTFTPTAYKSRYNCFNSEPDK